MLIVDIWGRQPAVGIWSRPLVVEVRLSWELGWDPEGIRRIVDHCRKSTDIEAQRAFGAARYVNGGAYYRRSLDDNMEARPIEGVQKDATQGRKSEKPWKGRPFTNFGRGYFIPNNPFNPECFRMVSG